MAPVKPSKKPSKLIIEKPVEKTIGKKKSKKKSYHSFGLYLCKILRHLNQDSKMGISRKSVFIMDNFIHDMLEKMSEEAGKLVSHTKKTTLIASDIQSAVKLLVPGELAHHANREGTKAVTTYFNNQPKVKKK